MTHSHNWQEVPFLNCYVCTCGERWYPERAIKKYLIWTLSGFLFLCLAVKAASALTILSCIEGDCKRVCTRASISSDSVSTRAHCPQRVRTIGRPVRSSPSKLIYRANDRVFKGDFE